MPEDWTILRGNRVISSDKKIFYPQGYIDIMVKNEKFINKVYNDETKEWEDIFETEEFIERRSGDLSSYISTFEIPSSFEVDYMN